MQGFLDTLLPVPAVQCLNLRLQSVEVGVFVSGEVLLHDVSRASQSRAGSVEDGGMRVKAGFLRHVGDAQILLKLQGAVIRFVKTGEDF